MRVVVENLSRSFGSSKVLRDLDLTLEPGITGILGPNGAGKTTLLRILSTALAPSKGSIKVGGWDLSTPHGRTGARRRLGYLPQEVGYYPRFTVFQLVDYIAVLKELDDRAERHRRVRAAIDAAGLEVDVEVDGGIDVATAPLAAEAGANVFVAGSAIFGHDKPWVAAEEIRESARSRWVSH